MNRLLVSVAFLTRLPVPVPSAAGGADVGRASLFFPAVGLLVGGLQAGAAFLLLKRLPDTVVAALVVALGVLVTGALHLDGLADTADGFGGGKDKEHALRIMRDHSVGAYGAAAIALSLILKVAIVSTLTMFGTPGLAWIALAPALGRWAPVVLGRALPYARAEGGLGQSVTGSATGPLEVGGATVLAVGAAAGLAGLNGAVAAAAAALATLLFGLLCRRKIGGVTGDTLGASVEIVEALVLVLSVALR
ncbi:MAG TPA: adenosylcobinamide-GDP ribazoletransferase [Anaeromyxobacteraceae bacterium]|nr:adenosylcobinamide-GDP ribazoletransferase [Anaeromyxobacteraceae bacterium]